MALEQPWNVDTAQRFGVSRRSARLWLALACTATCTGTFASAGDAPATTVSYPVRTMGTYANVAVVTSDSTATAGAARAAHVAFLRTDSLMSNWTETSEVARINREAPGGPVTVHPEVAAVLEAAIQTWRQSDGAFDITVEPLVRAWGFLGGPKRVPPDDELAAAFERVGTRKLAFDPASRTLAAKDARVRIDLGGIAKGYAVDRAADSLRARGIAHALVDVSGNMIALGHPPGRDAWRIGIRDPRDRMRYFATFTVTGEALATSGTYEQFVSDGGRRYGHILDPRTGRPAEGLIAVTVVAPNAMLADAWGTALFVLGPEAARRVAAARDDLHAILVEPGDGVDVVWIERALADRLTIDPAARRLFRVETF